MSTFDIGNVVSLDFRVTVEGVLVDPSTIGLNVEAPDGTIEANLAPVRDGVGLYHFDYVPSQTGTYLYRWVTTGVGQSADDGSFVVRPGYGTRWSPTPDEVHSQIPTRSAFTDTSIPSWNDVRNVIDLIADSLSAEFPTIPERAFPVARAYVTYSAAALLEAKYDPEQQFGAGTSPAALLDQRAGAEMARLRSLIATSVSGSGAAFTITPVGEPGYSTRPLNWWELNLT